jgi:peroxiredoxin
MFVVPAAASSANVENASLARLHAIQNEVSQAEAAFRREQAEHPATSLTPEGERLYEIFRQTQTKGEAAIFQIAKAEPESDCGYAALEWLVKSPGFYDDDYGVWALELMAIYHADDPRLGNAIAVLSHYPPQLEREPGYAPAVQLLQTVAAKNPDKATRGQAALGLAWLAKWKSDLAQANNLPEQDKLATVAESAYESLIREYGDCPNLYQRNGIRQTKTLGEQASHELFALRHLRVGKIAPNISGEDLLGKGIELAAYRGKVVLLVFWSSWCGPCMARVPDEKKLVDHFGARPFVIIGVNGDEDKEVARKTAAEKGITWRSFWNNGPDGPITKEWNLRGWPTTYVIDAEGVIRDCDHQGPILNDLLEHLVHQAEKAAE